MGDIASDTKTLAEGRGIWSATPWNYASLRSLWLAREGTGDLIYGYGQTIYARIKCRWEVVAPGNLRLAYLESPPSLRFGGFTPGDKDRVREVAFKLIAEATCGLTNVVGQPYKFLWKLELSEPPWPPALVLPPEIPRVFYGHRQQVSKPGA
jgi:hypothetical protein